jgi:methyl-accepting chemotaxis protein
MFSFKVRSQLALAFGALAIMVLLVSVLSLSALSRSNAEFRHYVTGISAQADTAEALRNAISRRAIAARNLVLLTDRSELAHEKTVVVQADEQVQQLLTHLHQLISQEASTHADALYQDIARTEGKYGPVAREIVALALRGEQTASITQMNELCRPLLEKLTQHLGAFVQYAQERSRAVEIEAAQRYNTQRTLLWSACALAITLALVAGLAITRSLTRALGAEPTELGAAARQVASGNLSPLQVSLTSNAASSGVLGSLSAMQKSLATMVGQVRATSDAIAASATQIAVDSRLLSERTDEQANALQETAATMESLSATVQHNAHNASQANQLAQGASTIASNGNQAVLQVVGTMKAINESSKRIADITGVIDSLAFQTNILALNAAVEAARAGEQGRGFAVVATEVRSLAQRSAQASREIKALITHSVTQIEEGTALADNAGATMHEMQAAIQRVADIMGDISAANSAQSTGVAQVEQAVSHMDEVTRQSAGMVQKTSEEAQALNDQAHALVTAMAQFKLQSGAETLQLSPPQPAQRYLTVAA